MSGDTRHLDKAALDILFTEARTQNAWLDKPVDDALLHEIWALTRMGPTSANAMPARLVFVKSAAAKELLRPALSGGNLEKTMSAPVVAIIAHDLKFYDQLPKLFPHADARAWFTGNAALTEATAMRNGTLQGAYLMMAARALGLDCGPMSGFDAAKVDAAFFPDGQVKTNFLCNLGYGSGEKLFPRSPRLTFDEACKIA